MRNLVPLFIAASILLAGNGVFSTLIAVRGAQEGMSPGQIGWMGTTYFAGFLVGCMVVPWLLRAVGYIRVFAALAATAAGATLLIALVIEPHFWMLARFVTGVCFSGLFSSIESWLNGSLRNENRGRVTAIYRVIDISAVAGGQYMIPVFGSEGFVIFCVMAMMISFSLVPVALGDRSRPTAPAQVHFSLGETWAISPVAVIGCIAIGLTNSAFRFVGPLYATEVGLGLADVATFISLGVVGGAIVQYPIGWLSDRFDRRLVLTASTLGAVVAGLWITLAGQESRLALYAGIFVFGAFSLPLYSLSVAHANDRATGEQYVVLASGLLFAYGIGATAGPVVSSGLLATFGPQSLFLFTCIVHGTLIVATVARMVTREAVPQARRGRFRALLRTSPVMQRLAQGRRTRR